MLRTALILATLALTACQTCPEPPLPEKVYITVEKLVAVPKELTKDCNRPAKQSNTYGEAIRLANARAAALDECTERMRQIRALDAIPAGGDQ